MLAPRFQVAGGPIFRFELGAFMFTGDVAVFCLIAMLGMACAMATILGYSAGNR